MVVVTHNGAGVSFLRSHPDVPIEHELGDDCALCDGRVSDIGTVERLMLVWFTSRYAMWPVYAAMAIVILGLGAAALGIIH